MMRKEFRETLVEEEEGEEAGRKDPTPPQMDILIRL